MAEGRLSARFGAETSDFKLGITAINRELKLVKSEFDATASSMDDWSNDATGLEARLKSLNKSIELQGEKVEALRYKFDDMARVHGENSVEAQNAGIEFNKEATKLNNLQRELGQTETSLKGLKNQSGLVRGAVSSMGKQFDALKQQVPALGTAFNLLTNPISLAVVGLGAFAAASKKSITELVSYNKNVREMMQLTGLSADETSRIIQVTDDWQIELGTARNALEMMNKKGFTPTVDLLAKIADQYVVATDKSAFMEAATKKYGKSFGDLIPILAKGGDALRDQTGAVTDNLIATDKSIAATREYEMLMDTLGDTATGLRNQLATGLLPKFNELLEVVVALTGTMLDEESAGLKLKKMYEDGTISKTEYNMAMISLRVGTDAYKDVVNKTIPVVERFDKGEKDSIPALDAATVAANKAAKAAGLLNDELREAENDLLIEQYARQIEDAKKQTEQLATASGNLNTALDTLMNQGITGYTDKLGEQIRLQALLDLWQRKITKETYNQVLANSFLIGNAEALNKLRADGNISMLTWLGMMSDGKVTTEELATAQGTLGEKADYAGTKMKYLSDQILGIEGDHEVGINVNVTGDPIPSIPGGGYIYRPGETQVPDAGDWATGGSFIVNRPTHFRAGESGIERVDITPASRFRNSITNIQQLVNMAMVGMNSQASSIASGGGMTTSISGSKKVEVTVLIQGGTGLERESARQGVMTAARAIGLVQ